MEKGGCGVDLCDRYTQTQQRYVETIDALGASGQGASTVALARKLGVSAPSVTEAVRRLLDLGIVVRRGWHVIELSPRGRRVAGQLERRHKALRQFMVEVLAMSAAQADTNACLIEHCADSGFVSRLGRLADFLATHECSTLKTKWRRHLRRSLAGRSAGRASSRREHSSAMA